MTKTPPPSRKSFFDSDDNDTTTFWKEAPASDFDSLTPIIEDAFFIKAQKIFHPFTSRTLTLYNSTLVMKNRNSPTVKFIDFEELMYKYEAIDSSDKRYSSKYKYSFTLSAQGRTVDFFCKENAQYRKWLSHLRKLCILSDFSNYYKIDEVLGIGGYGKVYLVEERRTSHKWAGKFIKISHLKSLKRQQAMIMNEIRIMRKMNHENVIQMHEVYEIGDEICIVMEHVQGEKLFNFILTQKKLGERETALIMKQLFLALSHIQQFGVIHRDVKPENVIIFRDKDDKVRIKLIDFGLGTFQNDNSIIKKCGTAGYVAPEILNSSSYNMMSDLFSAGILMIICMTGKPAFQASDYEELIEMNKRGLIKRGKRFNRLSLEAQNLVEGLTDPSPGMRTNLTEALNHEWFNIMLSTEDKKGLESYVFQFVKMNIPQEDRISAMPKSSSQRFVSRVLSCSGIDYRSQNSISQSYQTSQSLATKYPFVALSSFYKKYTRDSSLSDCNVSINKERRKGFKTFHARDNILYLPNQKSLGDLKNDSIQHPRSISLTPMTPIVSSRHNFKYKIQVSAIDSFDDRSLSSDGENPCGMMYVGMNQNPFQIRKVPQSCLPRRNRFFTDAE